jgi:adenosylcobyric acid synthase
VTCRKLTAWASSGNDGYAEGEQTRCRVSQNACIGFWDGNIELRGYEIHMGRTKKKPGVLPAFQVRYADESREDGAQSQDLRVWGTYLHGLFDTDAFRKSFLNGVRRHKGMAASPVSSYEQLKQDGFEKLAATVRASLDMQKIHAILQRGDGAAPSGRLL